MAHTLLASRYMFEPSGTAPGRWSRFMPAAGGEAARVLLMARHDARAAALEQALARAGHCTVGRCRSLASLLDEATRQNPHVVLLDIERMTASALRELTRLRERASHATVVFTEDTDSERMREALRAGVSAYIVAGFAPERIAAIVAVARARFEHDQGLRSECERARTQLAERKLIERAKGVLMRTHGVDEEVAYHTLRRLAMDANVRIAEVAQRMLEGAAAARVRDARCE